MTETQSQVVVEEQRTSPIWQNPRVRARYRLRKTQDRVLKWAMVVVVILVLYPLLDILYMFAYKGLLLISIPVLTQVTTGLGGGIANAITGSLLILSLSALISVPLGIFAGVYLAEFASEGSRYASVIRFLSDVLAGIPSIVLGYVGYLLFVLSFGWGFSALAAALTLSILMFPYVLRTTELAIRRVPDSIREGAIALGSTKTSMINKLTLRFAFPGIATGILLAVSISFSETAPLLYTASFSSYNPTAILHQPVGYLTYIVFYFSQEPFQSAVNLAYVASFVLLLFVVVVNLVGRLYLKRLSKI
jgi:phosphate transport system permease protein